MSSALAVSYQEHDYDPNRQQPRNDDPSAPSPQNRDTTSPHTVNHLETPDASSSVLSYSDFGDDPHDPFFGVDYSDTLDNDWLNEPNSDSFNITAIDSNGHAVDTIYPLTPDRTASVYTASPSRDQIHVTRPIATTITASISPQELQMPFKPQPILTQPSQLTPSQSSSARTSEDGLAPIHPIMPAQSPRVTVSNYDLDDEQSPHSRELEDDSTTRNSYFQSAGDIITPRGQSFHSASRGAPGKRKVGLRGPGGLGPANRPSGEVQSINDLANRRKSDERNVEVGEWVTKNLDELSAPEETRDFRALDHTRTENDDGIPLGDTTENRYVPGQTYYEPNGGLMNEQDREIIAGDRVWADAPVLHDIMTGTPGRFQPQTAQAAIERFERMCRDTDSILSRQATWGTRRRSIHSTADIDVEGILSGNFLKKLSISENVEKKLQEVRGFIRRPSISRLKKRRSSNASNYSNASDDGQQDAGPPLEKKDSTGSPHLAPPDRTSSWGRKPRSNAAAAAGPSGDPSTTSDGRYHTRKRSVGSLSITSPTNFLRSLKVENTLQRPRSRSELPKPTGIDSTDSHPNISGLWKAQGGPPVAALSRTAVNTIEPMDDEDDDDDMQDDSDLKAQSNLIDNVTPNFAGFQEHVLMLNPHMEGQSNYLVDRIAHQQIVRYKTLLGSKVKHLGAGAHCSSGPLCVAMGGKAKISEQTNDGKGVDPLVGQFDDDEGGSTPTDGAITQDSFPQDIPMPPTQSLPAEFECQLCFQCKKFTKPSDWTKHVHEDVSPFTCTWDRCRDAKSFKRKADWVRHENEGHRHLEWWKCNVEECRHMCYRRDNFLQHLVREHKYPEPKAKTKAAIKKSGNTDPTWQKVEECHELTSTQPRDEPCRFCGKTFPTWKKLTVHLAKHMEQISLPVLRVVAAKAKEISADTIISPVQDPPPRTVFNLPPNQPQESHPVGMFGQGQAHQQPPLQYSDPGLYSMYPMVTPPNHQYAAPGYYSSQYNNMAQTMQQQTPLTVNTMGHGYGHGQPQGIPVTSAPYDQGSNRFMQVHSTNIDSALEPFPQLPDNSMQDTSGLGLHNTGAGQMGHLGFGNMMDPSTASASPFSGQGSASPYMRSPHQNTQGHDQQGWDDGHMSGYQ